MTDQVPTPLLPPQSGGEESLACGHCGHRHACREIWSSPNKGPLSSGGLVLASLTAFLWPCVTAIAGGAWAMKHYGTQSNIPQFAGAGLGLLAGAALAALIVHIIKRRCSRPLCPEKT